jgi:hypothetical protein
MALSKLDTPIKILETTTTTAPNGVQTVGYTTVLETKCAVDHKLKASYLSSSGGWLNESAIAPVFQTITFRHRANLTLTTNHIVEMNGERYRILGCRLHHKMYDEAMIASVLNAQGVAYGSDSSN